MVTDDMKRAVREQKLGFIATVCPDGTPNLSPKGTTTVWDDDHLVFADIRSPQSVQNIRWYAKGIDSRGGELCIGRVTSFSAGAGGTERWG